MSFWLYQLLAGLSFAMLLFISSAGLALIFGVMRVLNLAHGAFYAVGAWVAIALAGWTGSLLLAAMGGIATAMAIGFAIERILLSRTPAEELPQALLTFGIMLMLGDLALWIWGGTPRTLARPEWLSGPVRVADIVFPSYRLFVIALGVTIAGLLWYLQARTRIGAMIRAAADDAETARGVGINVPRLSSGVFTVGAGLAALGGIGGGPIIGGHGGTELGVLLLAFVVVIIGGLGSLAGSFVGAIVVGLVDTLGKALLPDLALFTLFAPMALILALRPTGLFGRQQ